jgi:DNA repair exonuclease SbcCD ATPase subunit
LPATPQLSAPVELKSTWNRLTLTCHQVVWRTSRVLVICLVSIVLVGALRGQDGDPSDIFLKAYLSAQQGEKMEHENRFKAALAKFRFAGSLIEELRKSHSDWQPAIVEYRGRKIGDGILRVQERISRHNELNAAVSPLPEVVPSLPESEVWSEPGPEVVAPQGADATSQGSSDAAIEEGTKKLSRKLDQLQAALEKSRSDLATARKEKEATKTRLQQTSSKLEEAQKEIETSKQSEHQAHDELAQTQASFKAFQASQENGITEQLRAQIADLKNQVGVAEKARAVAEKQRDETSAKLVEANEQIAAAEQQRYETIAGVKMDSEMETHAAPLLSDNRDLKLVLANRENKVTELPKSDAVNTEEVEGLKQEVTEVQQQLVQSQKQNQYLVAKIAELGVELDETSVQLQNAKLTGKDNEETARLVRENEVLRNIVVRERHEEARRDQARKLMLAELAKLEIKSETLNKEIELLGQPVTKLSTEELSLLRQPVVSISEQNRGVVTAGFIFAKKSGEDSVETQATLNKSGGLKADAHDDPQSLMHTAKEDVSGGGSGQQKPISENPDQGSE